MSQSSSIVKFVNELDDTQRSVLDKQIEFLIDCMDNTVWYDLYKVFLPNYIIVDESCQIYVATFNRCKVNTINSDIYRLFVDKLKTKMKGMFLNTDDPLTIIPKELEIANWSETPMYKKYNGDSGKVDCKILTFRMIHNAPQA
jgi:hypothetical protein